MPTGSHLGWQMHAHTRAKPGDDWLGKNPENCPLYKQPKPSLLRAAHSKLTCVLFHMYFVFFHTYVASSTHSLLLINAFIIFITLVSLLNSFFKEDQSLSSSFSFSPPESRHPVHIPLWPRNILAFPGLVPLTSCRSRFSCEVFYVHLSFTSTSNLQTLEFLPPTHISSLNSSPGTI